MPQDGREAATEAAKQTAHFYQYLAERLEDAETDEEYTDAWRIIRKANKGDDDREQSHWIEIRLKDYFRGNGLWDEEQRYVDYDAMEEE